MIKQEHLEARGYRRYPYFTDIYVWQKWVLGRDEDGAWKGEAKLYSLDVYEYKFPKAINGADVPERLRFEPKVRLYLSTGGQIDVTMICDEKTSLVGVEAFYEQTFWKLDCVPDPYNQIVA